jgi:hypothetical protein
VPHGDALGRAIEALIGLLEANVVSQLVTVGVELTHFPPGLQGIWVGGWSSEKTHTMASVPRQSVHPQFLLHKGLGGGVSCSIPHPSTPPQLFSSTSWRQGTLAQPLLSSHPRPWSR